jgi:predicted nucleotidyltransferase
MLFTADMKDLLRLFDEHDVEYVLVGGFAVNYYGYVRTTQDIDLLILPVPENSSRVMAALADFGFSSAGIPQELFEQEGCAVHLGTEPNRIDLLTSLRGVMNQAVFEAAQRIELEGVAVKIISLRHLVKAKRSSDRARDLADVEELLKINEVS